MSHYTVLVIPEGTRPPRRFRVAQKLVRQGAWALGVAVALIAVVCIDYVRVRFDVVELDALRVSTAAQRAELDSLGGTLSEFEERLSQLHEFERKVRMIADLPPVVAGREDGIVAVGGGSERAVQEPNEIAPAPRPLPRELSRAKAAVAKAAPARAVPAGAAVSPAARAKHRAKRPVKSPTQAAPPEAASTPQGVEAPAGAEAPAAEVLPETPAAPALSPAAQLRERVRHLSARAAEHEASFADLLERLDNKRNLLASTPSIWPAEGWLTSRYGHRVSPFTGRRQLHAGIDIAAATGTPIIAPARGRVVFAGYKGHLGRAIVIDHGYRMRTTFGHAHELSVERGQTVGRGQQIASIGSTGRSTGPHLHYGLEIKGRSVNPLNYILE
jgi:murein DD-endopeptidase MepM/ murein hydrolase activator NlpD